MEPKDRVYILRRKSKWNTPTMKNSGVVPTGVIERDIPMLLLANNEGSKFYCPNTEYRDSLESTPSGRAKAKEILHNALRSYSSSHDRAVLDDIIAYKTFLYVFKDVPKSLITVHDKAGLTDFGCYTEPLDAQLWQIGDSVKQFSDTSALLLRPIITADTGLLPGSRPIYPCRTAPGNYADCPVSHSRSFRAGRPALFSG